MDGSRRLELYGYASGCFRNNMDTYYKTMKIGSNNLLRLDIRNELFYIYFFYIFVSRIVDFVLQVLFYFSRGVFLF